MKTVIGIIMTMAICLAVGCEKLTQERNESPETKQSVVPQPTEIKQSVAPSTVEPVKTVVVPASPVPVLAKPDGQEFVLLKNWTFGNKRPDATIRNKTDLDRDFRYRYIWNKGTCDRFDTSWDYHRDYPEGDPKSLHVFDENSLTLKGRIPPNGGLRKGGIESGMLRAKFLMEPGMYIEMRAKLPGGVGVWPNFWLEQGIEHPGGKVTTHSKVMSEIDIFEFFNWNGRQETRIIVCNTHNWGGKEAHGNPYDIFTTLKNVGYERNLDLGFDCSKDFHVFALDWVNDNPIWLVDGKPLKQTHYVWTEPGAHLVVSDSIGIDFAAKKGDLTQMVADEKKWDFVIDYIRIWKRKSNDEKEKTIIKDVKQKEN